MGAHRAVAILTSAAVVALGACYDEPAADREADTPEIAGETEQGSEEVDRQATEDVTTTRQRRSSLERFDTDESGDLDRDEWQEVWNQREEVGIGEAGQMEGLGQDEWTAYSYSIWDADNDEVLTETEWSESLDRWFEEEVATGSWSDWDQDGDSELDLNEMREGVEFDGLYERVDGDNDLVLDDEELADWFFEVFDADDNDRVDVTEWDWTAELDSGSER